MIVSIVNHKGGTGKITTTINLGSSVKAAEAPSFGKSAVNYAPSSTTAQDYKEFAKEVVRLSRKIHVNH